MEATRITCLDGLAAERAHNAACAIQDHYRRNDYEGTLRQVRNDLAGEVAALEWDEATQNYVRRYYQPDGSMHAHLDDVTSAWAAIDWIDIPARISEVNPKTAERVELAPAEHVAVYR